MIRTTMRKTSQVALLSSRRRAYQPSIPSTLSQSGTEYLQPGGMGLPCSILTERPSYEGISESSAMYSMLHLKTLMPLSILAPRFENGMSKAHTVSMTATKSNSLFSCKCFRLVLRLALVNVAQGLLPHPLLLPRGLPLSVRTGTLGSATTCALITASMVPALNVEVNTKQKMLNFASPQSMLSTVRLELCFK